MPTDPGRPSYRFDVTRVEAGQDLVAVGGDLQPATLLAAYRGGIFPMGLGEDGSGLMGWWSPDPRGILRLADLRVSRSLRRSTRRFDVTVDRAFADVVQGCGDPRRDRGWITPRIARAYRRLHELGWAHSVEVLDRRPARRGPVRRRDRRPVRGGVDVPPWSPTRRRSPSSRSSTCSHATPTPAGSSTCSGRPTTWSRSARPRSPARITCACSAGALTAPLPACWA